MKKALRLFFLLLFVFPFATACKKKFGNSEHQLGPHKSQISPHDEISAEKGLPDLSSMSREGGQEREGGNEVVRLLVSARLQLLEALHIVAADTDGVFNNSSLKSFYRSHRLDMIRLLWTSELREYVSKASLPKVCSSVLRETWLTTKKQDATGMLSTPECGKNNFSHESDVMVIQFIPQVRIVKALRIDETPPSTWNVQAMLLLNLGYFLGLDHEQARGLFDIVRTVKAQRGFRFNAGDMVYGQSKYFCQGSVAGTSKSFFWSPDQGNDRSVSIAGYHFTFGGKGDLYKVDIRRPLEMETWPTLLFFMRGQGLGFELSATNLPISFGCMRGNLKQLPQAGSGSRLQAEVLQMDSANLGFGENISQMNNSDVVKKMVNRAWESLRKRIFRLNGKHLRRQFIDSRILGEYFQLFPEVPALIETFQVDPSGGATKLFDSHTGEETWIGVQQAGSKLNIHYSNDLDVFNRFTYYPPHQRIAELYILHEIGHGLGLAEEESWVFAYLYRDFLLLNFPTDENIEIREAFWQDYKCGQPYTSRAATEPVKNVDISGGKIRFFQWSSNQKEQLGLHIEDLETTWGYSISVLGGWTDLQLHWFRSHSEFLGWFSCGEMPSN